LVRGSARAADKIFPSALLQTMTFYVLAERGIERMIIGPYRSFKGAEGAAQYWDKVTGWSTCVVPLSSPEQATISLDKEKA
jgi:uncharacterized membrane protein